MLIYGQTISKNDTVWNSSNKECYYMDKQYQRMILYEITLIKNVTVWNNNNKECYCMDLYY